MFDLFTKGHFGLHVPLVRTPFGLVDGLGDGVLACWKKELDKFEVNIVG